MTSDRVSTEAVDAAAQAIDQQLSGYTLVALDMAHAALEAALPFLVEQIRAEEREKIARPVRGCPHTDCHAWRYQQVLS